MAKRRAKGEGEIYRRKGSRWAGQYVVETATGTKRSYVYAKTRKEVAEKLRKAMGERDSEMAFDAGSLTLSDYLDCWLNDSARSSLRRRAFDRYEETSRLHIVPALGRVKLKALNPVHVQGLYRKKLDEGLSTRSVQYVHAEFVILRLLGAEGRRGVWVNGVHRGPFPTRWTPSPIRIMPQATCWTGCTPAAASGAVPSTSSPGRARASSSPRPSTVARTRYAPPSRRGSRRRCSRAGHART